MKKFILIITTLILTETLLFSFTTVGGNFILCLSELLGSGGKISPPDYNIEIIQVFSKIVLGDIASDGIYEILGLGISLDVFQATTDLSNVKVYPKSIQTLLRNKI